MTSEVRVNTLKARSGLGTVSFNDSGVVVSGIVTANSFVGDGSGLTNLPISTASSKYVYTGDNTWNKPSFGTVALVTIWGGGGSGGRGTNYGSGGGGGACVQKLFQLSDLPSSVSITIGAGGASRSSDGNGFAGGTTTFGALLSAYGGGRGIDADTAPFSICSGGGGGGSKSVGNSGGVVAAEGGSGQGPAMQGGTSSTTDSDRGGIFGGGAGGGFDNSTTPYGGGSSQWGGGGGGARGNSNGSAGTSLNGGDGGAAASSNATAGSIPSGGGGGCGGGSTGAGGNGLCIIYVW